MMHRAPDVKQVPKPVRDEQRATLALALQQRVSGDSGPHADGLNV